jgi:RHS repeat-associated protein
MKMMFMKKSFILMVSLWLCFTQTNAQSIPRPNIPAPKGFSVNSFTGNVFYQRTDLTLRGTGFPLYSTFYYNAVQDTLDYGYGNGWSFYYNAFYKESNDTLIIQHSDAKKDTFRLVNSAYKSPVGIYDTLIKSGTVFILRSKDGMEHIFADPIYKKLTGMNNRNGNSVAISYTGAYPTKIRNSSGRCLVLNWQNDHLADISDSSLPTKKYSYQYNSNKLSSVTNPLNGKIEYAYSNNNITRLADENNNPVVLVYSGGVRVKQICSCNSEQLFTYVDTLCQTYSSINNNAGTSVTSYLFDDKGRLKEITSPDNKKVTYTYDAQNNITKVEQPNNHTSNFTYSANGNLNKETDTQGFSTEYSYNNLNKITAIKDKKGNSSSFTYDTRGNVIGITKPGNITETYTYNAQGQILSAVNANGNTSTYEYNANGDLIKIISPIGTQFFEYGGGCCNLSKITDANGNNVFMTYDLMNRLTSVEDDLNHTTTYQYDAGGNLIKETDPNGNVKNYGYDAANQLTSVQIPIGTWLYDYDGAGNFIKMKDAKGNNYAYAYDINNRLIKETDPLGNSTTYAYDDNGNLIEKREAKGNTISFKYDEEDRLIERAYPGNTDKYSYDANGNMVAAYNNNIAYSFEYDALNRLTRKAIPTWNKSITYTYDAVGNRSTMADPDGGINNYVYDSNNRLISLTNHASLTSTFIYDDGGRLKRQNNANGTYATYSYDAAGRVDSILHRRSNGDTIAYNFYSFDQFGNRLSMKDKYGLHVYNYDAAHRLTNVIYGDGSTENFTMDANGNRTSKTKNSVATNYTYNNADQIITAGAGTYNFDLNGNTISNTETGFARIFTYDGLNRLTEVQVTANKKWQTKYDPFGEKIEKLDTSNILSRMIYDGENLLGELNSANAFTTKYTTALGTDSWLMQQQGGNTYYFHSDGLNSTSVLTNSLGNKENEYYYDAYGNINIVAENINNKVLFTGRLLEKSLGLYDFRSRLYNSEIGNFINRDQFQGYIKDPLSTNKFIYTQDNPTNFIDPFGNYLKAIQYAVRIAKVVRIIHLYRNYLNELPPPSPNDAKKENWKLEENQDKTKYHQKNPKNPDTYDRYKYTKMDDNGITSSEAIWDNTEKRWLECGEEGGPSFNFVHPTNPTVFPWQTGRSWNTQDYLTAIGHTVLDIIPHEIFGGNYKCPPPKKPGPQEPYGPPSPPPHFDIPILRPVDPNEIVGTTGYDTTIKWVSINATLPYKILFENDPEFATAPAQKVIIYCPIDTKINPGSLRLGDFGFGNFNFSVPANSSFYTTRLDVRDSLGVFVDVTAGLDITNRRAFWIFESIDPATGLAATLPADAGFLPVNDSITHNGEGYVNFTVKPVSIVQTRDTVSEKASIIFDSNEEILTNSWKNTIDAIAPVSLLDTLPSTVSPAFTISWTGQDDNLGVGIKSYDLYVSQNSGPFILVQANIDSLHYNFVGQPGVAYSFYIRAVDLTGNREAAKSAPYLTVLVGLPNSTICPGSNVSFTAPSNNFGYSYQWQVDTTGTGTNFINISNNSVYNGAASNVLTLITPPTSWYGYKYQCVVATGGTPLITSPQTLKFSVTWSGSLNTAWENPANWSCNKIPDGFTDVIIPSTSVILPLVNSNAACYSLTLKPGTSLTVISGFTLDIKGK